MWQQVTVIVLVLLAALYAAWKLSPRQWRRRFGLESPPEPAKPDDCGCGSGSGKKGCH